MKQQLSCILLIFLLSNVVKAQYVKLLDFSSTTNGSAPQGDLVSDGIYLYGMTRFGGTHNSGVIFKIKPDGSSYSKLLDFNTSINGASPYGSLIIDSSFLYGMTPTNVFKIKTDGTGYSTLLTFTGTNGNGGGAFGSLISDGTFLYGMTYAGGTNICDQYGSGCGIIFKIKTDGTGYTKLLDFGGPNGANPFGSLISDGTFLYGMARHGGYSAGSSSCLDPKGCGTVFKIKTDGTGYVSLYNFDGTVNGSGPTGSLISDDTFLYGMTNSTIFKINQSGTNYFKLMNIESNGGSLISDGTFLYGMTLGSIFKIKPDGTEFATMFNFTEINGCTPVGSLISDGTHLYGMTSAGGTNNMGVIFSFNLSKPTSINNVSNTQTEINVFPNPTTSEITITIASVLPREEFIIKVTDPLNKTVYSETLKELPGSISKQIDLSSLSKGIYFVVIESTNSNNSKKHIKETRKIILQ